MIKILTKTKRELSEKEKKELKNLSSLLELSTLDRFMSKFNFNKRINILYVNNKIIGFLCHNNKYIFGISISSKEQKKGYGSLLINHALRQLQGQQQKKVYLFCNLSMISYYEQFGFVPLTKRIRMTKEL